MRIDRQLRWVPGVLFVALACCFSAGEEPAQTASGPADPGAEGTDLVPPQIILKTQKSPEFPPAALAARFTGTVTLRVTVQPDGQVGDVDIVHCTRPKVGFEDASIAAVKQWRFEPATNAGEPVEYTTQFRLNFRNPKAGSAYVTAGPGGTLLNPDRSPTVQTPDPR
jgi:TonB family protein